MLIKLDDDNKFLGGRVDKAMVKSMVYDYRNVPAEKLFYAHFQVAEILQLLVDNGAISEGALGHIMPNYGVKIYIGQHNHISNCPQGRHEDYMGKNTMIVCATFITDEKKFRYSDKLVNKRDTILLSGARLDNNGNALDQSSTYPPDNPYQGQPPIPIPSGEEPDTYDVGLI